jgi:drug/metabolite transporter (DMT)-like permease
VNSGEIAGLGAALMWACSSMFWGRIPLTAAGINLAKNTFGIAFLGVHLLVAASLDPTELVAPDTNAWWNLLVSGLIGIAIGDTFFFRSLQILGPQRSLMVASLAPLFSALLGWLQLNQALTLWAILGVVFTIIGVMMVIADRKSNWQGSEHSPGKVSVGVILGVLAAMCQALGTLYSKFAMDSVPALEVTLIRIALAALIIFVSMIVTRKLNRVLSNILKWKNLRMILPGTAIGTWLGIWFSQIAIDQSRTLAAAQTMLATSPIFAIPLMIVIYRYRPTLLGVLGTLVGFLGVYLVLQ